jgi:ankyrin repeat protein
MTTYLDEEEKMTLLYNLSNKGYIKNEEVVKVFTTFDLFEMIWEYMYYEEEIERVIEKGYLKIIKEKEKLKLENEEENTNEIKVASEYGHLEVIKYLHSLGYKGDERAINMASKNGHLDVIKYLHSLGYKGNYDAIVWASMNGHLEVVKYLHYIGYKDYKISRLPIYLASSNGHLKIIKYLISVGYRGDLFAIGCASFNGHLKVKKYLISIGSICNRQIVNDIEKFKLIFTDFSQYL